MEFKEGTTMRFTASAVNTGRPPERGRLIPAQRNGQPLKAGDLEDGKEYLVNTETGEVADI